jgi:hypothetical protein
MKPDLTAVVAVERVLELAKRAPVFPCRRADHTDQDGRVLKAKSPLTRNGFKDATQDEQQIRRWWAASPEALVGVPTGSITGLVVIDYDHRSASSAAQDWISEHQLELTKTRVHQTGGGSGGRHYLFRAPAGVKIRGGASVVLGKVKRAGLDIRAEGGVIFAPPTRVRAPNDEVREYTVLKYLPAADMPPAAQAAQSSEDAEAAATP